MAPQTRQIRTFRLRDIVVAFAGQGVPIDTIARAMLTSVDEVRGVCRRAVDVDEIAMMPPDSRRDVASSQRAELVNLRARLETTEQLLAEHRAESAAGRADRIVGFARLTPQESQVVALILRRGRVRKQTIYNELHGARLDDGPDPKTLDVVMSSVRRKLKPYGVRIATLWGFGYEIASAEDATRLETLLAEWEAK